MGVPGGLAIRDSLANAGETGFIPGLEKIPHATEQLRLYTTTTELVCWGLGATAADPVC